MNKNFLNNIKYFFGRNIKSINDQIKPNPKVEQNDINKQNYV